MEEAAAIAREALEEIKDRLGAYLASRRHGQQSSKVLDAYSLTLRALRRLERAEQEVSKA